MPDHAGAVPTRDRSVAYELGELVGTAVAAALVEPVPADNPATE